MTDRTADSTTGGVAMTERNETATQRITGSVANAAKRTGSAVASTARTSGPAGAERAAAGGSSRRARLLLSRIDPWSVMKMAFLLSIALSVVLIVAVFVIWSVLGAAGVWDAINQAVQDVVGDSSAGWNVQDYLGLARVMGFTMVVSVVNIVLMTAVATLAAFLYNMAAALLGGVEVELTEN
ncbi:hypothetical protein J2S40_004064 [Nocardioides luteus]|uniref:DUF3566 domain-containing protein n=1 Tax=Nocardioides luteus TaxID=1844 RepID=A0ABQ5SQM5_9ACTN|nr:DUF3566 domain-containing protein [Nocardioides luteus]MDR7313006.1 hypothetical protein [Nocardioides luteus]GGR44731.1 hypothetical protein GCM10010197_07950 [Nocardioides luteus]GLJ66066.1 hypothetical protein GCM10017579_01020 [Nocardioides luteus]